jgi:hypothetical protein
MRDLAVELVEFVDDVVDELGSRKDRGRSHPPPGRSKQQIDCWCRLLKITLCG